VVGGCEEPHSIVEYGSCGPGIVDSYNDAVDHAPAMRYEQPSPASPISYAHVEKINPELFALLHRLDVQLERLRGEQTGLPGRMKRGLGNFDTVELEILELARPGMKELIREVVTTSAGTVSETFRRQIDSLIEDFTVSLPGVGLPRWVSQSVFDERMARRTSEGVGRIHITPRDFAKIKQVLKIDATFLQNLQHTRVISIGEGGSNFARTLETEFGAKATAADWWYGLSATEMQSQILIGDRYVGQRLARVMGHEEALARLPSKVVVAWAESLPFADQSFDHAFLANFFIWYFSAKHRESAGLDEESGFQILAEALRVAKTVRFNMGGKVVANQIMGSLVMRFAATHDIIIDDDVIAMTRKPLI